jgi:hypothetical protein
VTGNVSSVISRVSKEAISPTIVLTLNLGPICQAGYGGVTVLVTPLKAVKIDMDYVIITLELIIWVQPEIESDDVMKERYQVSNSGARALTSI